MSELARLRVEQAGPLALLQDAGRFGVRRLGVTQGGPADPHAWAWANRLAGNSWGAAVLEITLGGLTLVAERDAWLALAGADLGATLDGEPLTPWRRFRLGAGQRLAFAMPRAGLRAYLAVPGGFHAEAELGSLACVVREGLGGHRGEGRALAAGDALAFRAAGQPSGPEEAPPAVRPDYAAEPRLALIPGAQIAAFRGSSLFAAFHHPWRVDARADRMGVRLTGPKLECAIDSLVSEGIGLGAVQVPPDGQPIVLLNDRQTIGGYPRLGSLTPLACARLAQCQPGQRLWLRPQGREAAHNDFVRWRREFD
ncbi:biotin-dependent carboxyltransferase family protein [Bisbaumannia pacifica]|uniref:Biotin-dependent carboxyltransferase family protein n=1 Tax=Bisbaumannia pacifica TaxID=77098 RepID=A0ABD4KZG9_9GAMM|nr:biotin-dependent carboxyltransferase family protein [Halomonas pacifica]MBH8578703.1 biotin-dependent carboxyltransferase family protein [Halomonas pacifica]